MSTTPDVPRAVSFSLRCEPGDILLITQATSPPAIPSPVTYSRRRGLEEKYRIPSLVTKNSYTSRIIIAAIRARTRMEGKRRMGFNLANVLDQRFRAEEPLLRKAK